MDNGVESPSWFMKTAREYCFWIVAAGWTLLLLLSFFWNNQNSSEQIIELVQMQARTAYDRDVLYRFWNSVHGSVYVPVTPSTPPNPYLDVAERDITTPGGIKLTLMNPAYMTRQANELGIARLGIYGHLTSINPLRPENAPDQWEQQALLAFEAGSTEVSSIGMMAGKQVMRLMRPLLVEKECIECHAKQGYSIGEIRGGISVSISMEPSMALLRSTGLRLAVGHVLFWLMGLAGLVARARMIARWDRERRETAEELRQNNAQLEQRVSQRTLELNEANLLLQEDIRNRKAAEQERARMAAQLRQAQKMEILGTLSGGIAHDFNNLLTPILGYAELAQLRPEISPQLQKDLAQISAAAERGKGLVAQILSFSHRTEKARVVVSMQQIVGEVLELVRPTSPKTITLEVRLAEQPLLIDADPAQLHQVVMNLCTNAWHAMQGQDGTLQVTLERVDASQAILMGQEPCAKEYACLKVCDDGHGIDPQTREKLFEPFFTTKKKGEGTGLGLSVVQGIIHGHSGAICVESRVGQGSCFLVFLPLVEAQPPARQIEPVLNGQGERILLVDDEIDIVEMLVAGLNLYGFKTSGFTSSLAALQQFQADPERFDLLLSDRLMPGLSGQQLADAVREIRPELPVIFMTGYDAQFPTAASSVSGGDHCLAKPVTAGEVAAQIVRQLTGP